MKSIWKGTLSFGLVNIPVRLYPATQERRLDFDYLSKRDLSPVGYLRVNRASGKVVPWDEVVRGYEYKKGDYVIITDEDFRRADVKKTQSMEILDFVDKNGIETKYFEKPYFLEPTKGSAKMYALLRLALARTGKVGIARFVLRTQEHIGAILPDENGVLNINLMRYKHELRTPAGLAIPAETDITETELSMAVSLIGKYTTRFNPARYRDIYTEELKETIGKKAEGKKIPVVKSALPQPTKASELMDTLRASLEHIEDKERYAYS